MQTDAACRYRLNLADIGSRLSLFVLLDGKLNLIAFLQAAKPFTDDR